MSYFFLVPVPMDADWRSQSDAVSDSCMTHPQAGAAGNETAAAACMGQWHARIPPMQAELEKVRQKLWKALPNADLDGTPLSGSYWAETDCKADFYLFLMRLYRSPCHLPFPNFKPPTRPSR